MKAVITVIGKDKIGIVYKIMEYAVKHNLNITYINQSVVDGLFEMFLIADISKSKESFKILAEDFTELGKKINMNIKVQHEDIFNAMNQI